MQVFIVKTVWVERTRYQDAVPGKVKRTFP